MMGTPATHPQDASATAAIIRLFLIFVKQIQLARAAVWPNERGVGVCAF